LTLKRQCGYAGHQTNPHSSPTASPRKETAIVQADYCEKLLNEILESYLGEDGHYDFADALINDLGGVEDLAARLDEVNADDTESGLLNAFNQAVANLDDETYWFIAHDADAPAAHLATLV
jgi:hypothetical protein